MSSGELLFIPISVLPLPGGAVVVDADRLWKIQRFPDETLSSLR